MSAKATVKFFVSYAHDDHKKKEEFLKALGTRMKNSKLYNFELWTDRQLLSGEDWRSEIELALELCELGMLLVSQNFLASTFIVDEELPTFVKCEKPCIPVGLLPVSFGEVDLKGLEAKQVFRWQHPQSGEFKEFSSCRGDAKTHFVDQLVGQIEARLKKLAQQPTPVASGPPKSTNPPPSPTDVESKMRKVFGPQFDAIKKLIETNDGLRKQLTDTFIRNAKSLSHDETTYKVMFEFYTNFCDSLGAMDVLYRKTVNREHLLESLSSFIFLALNHDMAEELKTGGVEKTRAIPQDARQGVASLIKAWIQGEDTMPIRELAAQQNHEMWDCVPGDERKELLENIMKRTPGVDPTKPGAEDRFRLITHAHARRKTFIHAIVDQKQLALLGGDLSQGGLLENVLIFAKAAGETIFQDRQKDTEAAFEEQLNLFLETLNKYE